MKGGGMSCKECKYFDGSKMTLQLHDLIEGCGICTYIIPLRHIPNSFFGGGIRFGIDCDKLKINGYMHGCSGIDCPVFKSNKDL